MGRPRKEAVESEEIVEVEKPKKAELKKIVVSYGKYLQEARELLSLGPVAGMEDVWDVAISLLYDRNKVIGIVQKGGETRFVCEVE